MSRNYHTKVERTYGDGSRIKGTVGGISILSLLLHTKIDPHKLPRIGKNETSKGNEEEIDIWLSGNHQEQLAWLAELKDAITEMEQDIIAKEAKTDKPVSLPFPIPL